MKSFLFLLLLVYCSLANAGTYVKKKSDACGAYILKPGNYCNLASSYNRNTTSSIVYIDNKMKPRKNISKMTTGLMIVATLSMLFSTTES